ncbi:MAG: GlxA family transcriptional regulator [Vicinamibacteria bacterium]
MAERRRKAAARPPPRDFYDVTVVLVDDGYASTAIAPIEVFFAAGRLWNLLHGEAQQPRFRVRTVSVDGKPVRGLVDFSITPGGGIGDVARTDIVVISASGWDIAERVAKSKLMPWLRSMHARGAYVTGICSGVALVAESGLLDGRQATTHWAVAPILAQRYPKVRWRSDQFVTEDGHVLCSGGVYASIDVALYLVEKLCGHEIALRTAKSLLVGMPRSRQSGYAVLPLSRPHADERIRRAEEYMQKHYADGYAIEAIAERIGMSPRNFIRRFKAATGSLPGAYAQAVRIAAAKTMLEQGQLSIQAVCERTGYEDVAFFRALFKRHTGMTPHEYRDRFAGLNVEREAVASGSPERA